MGEGKLTDLTLELSKVVGHSYAFEFLLDLAVYPGFEAPHMNSSTATLAVAGGDQGIVLCLLIAEADLAVALFLFFASSLLNLKHSISFFKVVSVP